MDKDYFFEYQGRTTEEIAACAQYCRQMWREETEHILRVADEVTERIFLFDLPWDMEQTIEPVIFKDTIQWDYMPGDDPEFIYQLNRHRYWICLGQAYVLTGEERYVETFVRQLKDWISKNPVDSETKKTTWRTIESGMRGENWVKAMGYMEHSPHITTEVMELFRVGLILHGERLLSCDIPFSMKSNWGILESCGLYAIGKALGNETYAKTALRRLEQQMQVQIQGDGVHWEQSPMYHNEVLRCCLEVVRLAGVYGDYLPADMLRKIKAMAYADRIWQLPDYSQPMNGDSDQTDLRDILTGGAYLFRDAVLKSGAYKCMDFEGIWIFGMKSVKEYEEIDTASPECLLCSLPDSGNWFLRSGWGEQEDYFHFMNGSLGGGHGHFDKLHVDMSIRGEEVLVDCGRYTYVDGSERRRLKSAMAHNTITVDGVSYAKSLDSWGAKGLAPSMNSGAYQHGIYTLFQGGHRGYMDKGIYVHRKIIAIGTRIYLIMDICCGKGEYFFEQHYHISPLSKLEKAAYGFDAVGRTICTEFHVVTPESNISIEKFPMSRHYNQMENGYEAVIKKAGGRMTSLTTVLISKEKEDQNLSHATKVPVKVPVTGRTLSDDEAEAVQITYGAEVYTVIFNHVDTGADCEYMGAGGLFGLGRIMVARSSGRVSEMTVLEW